MIVALIGAAIIVLGFVLLPLPGPGWLIIFVGLGVLASEFAWAGRLLDVAKEKVGQWSDWVVKQSLVVRVVLALATLAIVVGAVYAYHRLIGLPGWIPGIG